MFKEFYGKLTDVLSVVTTDITHHLVSANVITLSKDEEVMSPTTSREQAKKLLLSINGPLKAGHVESLTELLKAMEQYGNDASIKLSREINEKLSSRRRRVVQSAVQSTYI